MKGVYFKKLIWSIISNFFYLIITGGQVEDAIQHGKLSYDFAEAIELTAKKHTFPKKKEGDNQMIG